jgi:hypothetical protein
MTLSEICVLLEDPRGRTMSDDQIVAEHARWRGLTPRERIEEVKRCRQ